MAPRDLDAAQQAAYRRFLTCTGDLAERRRLWEAYRAAWERYVRAVTRCA